MRRGGAAVHSAELSMGLMGLLTSLLALVSFGTAGDQHTPGGHVTAVLGDSVKFPGTVNCSLEKFELIRRLKDDRPLTVATLVGGDWEPEEEYRGRFQRSASDILLTRVNYNDDGVYEFTCGSDVVLHITLQVFIISNNNISESQGATVKLSCYSFTAGQPVKSVWWERNNKPVFKLNTSNGNITYGMGFDGRVSLASDWKPTGDFSLTLERVQPEDRGDYSCFVQKEKKERGIPAVTRLKVHPSQNTTSTPPTAPPPQDTEEVRLWKTSFIVTLILLILISAAVFRWWILSRRSDSSSGPPAAGPSTAVEMGLLNGSRGA
ncbi:uncharacterized protein PAE49_021881 [Odontesthes bonariensis]|uniref:uncharacterized protein LOC142368906 n=1 Tax=Odontesthes bonariensis TaxID=219752 RepID=UPI003F5823A0